MTGKPRLTARDFDPEVLRLFDQYVHGDIDRRGFLSGTARIAGGMAAATGLLALLAPRFAAAQQVKPDDPRIQASTLGFDSPEGNGKASGYLVRPAGAGGKAPVVLVVHENRGLNPHIEDVARRFATEGYIAFAPDALFPLGGYPGEEDAARAEFAKLDQAKAKQDFLAAAKLLKEIDGGNGRLGATGFCWGGGMTHWLATQLGNSLDAAAPFYGPAPAPEEASKVKAELLVVQAADDERVNKTWPPYETALKEAKVEYALYQPEGTQHGFHNDTTPRYDEAAAKEAWKRTLALFDRRLRKAGAA